MGKVSPVSIKYSIKVKFHAEGVVEKPDVIGAIFGQTEGLLGEDLELRELQKNGKIGRINVELESKEGKTDGEIEVPTSLDKTETTVIAAALETIERVGPADVKITIDKIEDVRGNKRDYVFERAKKLLEEMSTEHLTSREIGMEINSAVRKGKIIEYGEEKLPAGPDIDLSKEIIVVEGRADVINLLSCGIKNAIAMNGTSLPNAIKELSKDKVITLFIDGDRGGLLNARGIASVAKIDFVAQAPFGREVEELSSKEIISSLRNKETIEDFFNKQKPRTFQREFGSRFDQYKPEYRFEHKTYQKEPEIKESESSTQEPSEPIKELDEETRGKMRGIMESLPKGKNVYLVDDELKVIKKMNVSELIKCRRSSRAFALIINGAATNNIANMAEKIGCKHLIAKNFAVNYPTKINLVSV